MINFTVGPVQMDEETICIEKKQKSLSQNVVS